MGYGWRQFRQNCVCEMTYERCHLALNFLRLCVRGRGSFVNVCIASILVWTTVDVGRLLFTWPTLMHTVTHEGFQYSIYMQ